MGTFLTFTGKFPSGNKLERIQQYFRGTSQMDTFACSYRKLPKQFPQEAEGPGKRREDILRCYPKGKIFPSFSPKRKIFPSLSPKRKIFPLGRKFPHSGKISQLGNIFAFGNIFPFCALFLFGENIHPVGKYSHMGTFLTFTGNFPNGDKLERIQQYFFG